MYTEQIAMRTRTKVLLALPFAFTVAILAVLLTLVPMPFAGRVPIIGAIFLEATIGALLVASLSRVRIVVDDSALTVAFRILIKSRTPLHRIVTCGPTDWRGWGISYRLRGTQYFPRSPAKRAVRLMLANGAEVLFKTQHPDAVCAALRARRPQIRMAGAVAR